MANRILDKVESVLEIQLTPGGSNRAILDVSNGVKNAIGDITKSFGAITRNYRLDPSTNEVTPRPVKRDQPEPVTAEVTALIASWNYLEQLDANSRVTLYVRWPVNSPSVPLDYDRVDILTDVALESITIPAPVADAPTTDDTVLTVPINAASHILINPVAGSRIVTGIADANDCNALFVVQDDDGTIFAVTEADATGLKPFLLKSTDKGATWTSIELTDLGSDCTALCVAGDYLVIAAGTEIGVHDKDGAQVNTYTAAQIVNALAAVDGANIIAAGAAGLLIMSDDGGLSWSALASGVATALNSIAVRSINEWYVGGASKVFLKYDQGTISALTANLPAALNAATITTIALPKAPTGFSRDNTIFIGSSIGNVYKSDDGGETWAQIDYPDDGAGTVKKLAFTGFLGQVLYILHETAGGAGILKRDWSGGVGGTNNAEAVGVPTNSGLNDIVLIDANAAVVVGNVHSANDMIVKVQRNL